MEMSVGDKMMAEYEKNWEQLEAADQVAKAKGKLTGRYIQEPFADGYAIYRITRTTKHTVTIKHVCLGGDDWMIPYWGEETKLSRQYGQRKVSQRDVLANLFAARKE